VLVLLVFFRGLLGLLRGLLFLGFLFLLERRQALFVRLLVRLLGLLLIGVELLFRLSCRRFLGLSLVGSLLRTLFDCLLSLLSLLGCPLLRICLVLLRSDLTRGFGGLDPCFLLIGGLGVLLHLGGLARFGVELIVGLLTLLGLVLRLLVCFQPFFRCSLLGLGSGLGIERFLV